MKTRIPTLLIYSLTFFVILPKGYAVSPPPDGGYPGGNTAEGASALLSRTTGLYNTAVGIYSVLSLADGSFCTGIGAGALLSNTADQNTATGAGALLSNTTGGFNTANGTFALFNNTTGEENTATGGNALFSNTAGSSNTAHGFTALDFNTTGSFNTAVGTAALVLNTAGNRNTATGFQALFLSSTANDNTAYGYQALSDNQFGGQNTAVGSGALLNTTGAENTAVGANALFSSTGSGNTALGENAGGAVMTASNVICIGAAGADVDNSCFIGNIFNQSSPSGTAVFVNSDGKLGTTVSSRRFKDDIKPMDKTSEAILALKPVTFRYKKEFDPTGLAQFGLVAEDVEKVNPDLVVRDKEGKPYSVRYDQVNAMLLNEFLKEHRTVQEQQATTAELRSMVTQQQKEIQGLTAGLQKVNAQLEAGKPMPQVVAKNP
jgi:hypothetical protein